MGNHRGLQEEKTQAQPAFVPKWITLKLKIRLPSKLNLHLSQNAKKY